MFRLKSVTLMAAWLVLCLPNPVSAGTLVEAIEAALLNDPVVKSAASQRNASAEARPQALSKWLPQVSAQAGKSKARSVQQFESSAGVRTASTAIGYDSDFMAVTLRQSLFNPRAWYNLRQSAAMVGFAEATFELAKRDAINRIVGGFADKLRLEAELDATKMEIASLESRFRQAKRFQSTGQSSLVEVRQTETGLRQAEAKLGEQSATLQATNWELARVTGMQWDEFITGRDYRSMAVGVADAI